MNKKSEKILIISDIHLTTNFIKRKYEFLEKLFLSVDKIIINGDFWTAYYNTFDEFLGTNWKGLFPILKNKKTIYIYGNHDKKMWQDDRNNIFSDYQSEEYRLETNGVKYLITHGHTYLGDSISTESFMKTWRFFKFDVIKYFFEALLLKTIGRNIYRPAALMNSKLKDISKNLKEFDYLVVGHTHWSEIDKQNKFINSGIIHSGVADYILIEHGLPKVINNKY